MTASRNMTIDALLPAEMALRAEKIGVSKAHMSLFTMFALGVLAGIFIALGAIFATTVTAPTMGVDPATGAPLAKWLPFGITKLIGGVSFCLGLILVVVAGAELFTGNNLIIMAWANRRISTSSLLRNWAIVYVGNFVGSILTVIVMLLSGQYTFGNGAVGLNALNIAQVKVGYGFIQAVFLGSLCNMLVCLAVWLVFSARTTTDKILSIIFPITAFVAAGFEHSIANMYFVPIGLGIKQFAGDAFWSSIGSSAANYAALTWGNFLLRNLLPVTIGNIIGGALGVGVVYYVIYLRNKPSNNMSAMAADAAEVTQE
ncbi:MAG: formate transporter FocA [Anaerolineae bacterium SG8_19]|jgi:formate transporter FocA|nr:MAG: formate transporter FocA [Anaerolineae bacterium SG8_19]